MMSDTCKIKRLIEMIMQLWAVCNKIQLVGRQTACSGVVTYVWKNRLVYWMNIWWLVFEYVCWRNIFNNQAPLLLLLQSFVHGGVFVFVSHVARQREILPILMGFPVWQCWLPCFILSILRLLEDTTKIGRIPLHSDNTVWGCADLEVKI